MSKTVPATFSAPSLIQFGTGEDIDGEDFLTCVQAEHHLWSRTGARVCGLILNPVFTTTSVTYTQTTGSSSRNLSGWTGVLKPRRRVLSAGTYYWALSMDVYAANADVRATFVDSAEAGAGTSTTLTVSVVGATVANASGLALLPVTASEYLVYIEAKYNAAGTARLAQFGIYESLDPSSYYP